MSLAPLRGAVAPATPRRGQPRRHGEAGHAGQADRPDPLAFDPDLAIWTAIVFLVLLGVLGKFAWGPIVDGLEKREQTIADNIAAAERASEEAKAMLAEYEAKLAGAADEVRAMLEEARRDAEHTKQEILAEAKSARQAEQRPRDARDRARPRTGAQGVGRAERQPGRRPGRQDRPQQA